MVLLPLPLLAWLALPVNCSAAGVQYLDIDTLKSMLGDPQVLIIDVRTPVSWDVSDSKIKGAVRQEPGLVKAWARTLPKDNKIVLYCA